MEQPIATKALTANHTASKKCLGIMHTALPGHGASAGPCFKTPHVGAPAQASVQVNMENAQAAFNLSAGRFRKSLNQNEMQFSGRKKSANLSAAPPAADAGGGIRWRRTVMAAVTNCSVSVLTQLTQRPSKHHRRGCKPFASKHLRTGHPVAGAANRVPAVLTPAIQTSRFFACHEEFRELVQPRIARMTRIRQGRTSIRVYPRPNPDSWFRLHRAGWFLKLTTHIVGK